jgi:hypothetical protein
VAKSKQFIESGQFEGISHIAEVNVHDQMHFPLFKGVKN